MSYASLRNGFLSRTLFVCGLVFLIGCGGGAPDDRPDLGKVSGKVTQDGKPVQHVNVTFYPDSGRPSSGKTDENGVYTLIYTANTPGAKVGNHKVQITVPETAMGEEGEDLEGAPAEKMPPEWVKISKKYNTETTLTAEVKAGENTFDFDLKNE